MTFSRAVPVETTQEHDENHVGYYVATSGNLTVKQLDGTQVTFNSVPAGTFIPMVARQCTSAPANTLVLYK